jgi:hypothetical protein
LRVQDSATVATINVLTTEARKIGGRTRDGAKRGQFADRIGTEIWAAAHCGDEGSVRREERMESSVSEGVTLAAQAKVAR